MKRIVALILAMLMMFSLAACGGSNDAPETTAAPAVNDEPQTTEAVVSEDGTVKGTGVTLTIYSNSVSDGRGDWLVERAAQDGFDIQYVDAGAAEVQARLIAEKESPIADVVFGLNAIIWASLKSENILVPYVPAWSTEVDAALNDPEGYYHAIVKQAILLAYDANQISADAAPTDWIDLWTNEEFHGAYEYETGLGGGTTRNVIAGILSRYADPNGDLGISEEGWAAIAAFYANGIPDEDGMDLYAQIVSDSSTVLMGQMWSSGIATRDEQYGTSTAYVVPEVGVPYAVEGVAIVNGTKNMEEAKRFVEWFGTAQIQGEWCEEFATLPANVNAVEKANDFNKAIAEIPAQDIDWDLVSANIDAWCEKIILEYMP